VATSTKEHTMGTNAGLIVSCPLIIFRSYDASRSQLHELPLNDPLLWDTITESDISPEHTITESFFAADGNIMWNTITVGVT